MEKNSKAWSKCWSKVSSSDSSNVFWEKDTIRNWEGDNDMNILRRREKDRTWEGDIQSLYRLWDHKLMNNTRQDNNTSLCSLMHTCLGSTWPFFTK